ncbi:MAG: sarcosine oxidase subunit gamma [Pseudomonadota bacterium]
MAEITLTAAPTLGGIDIRIGDNRITERDDLALVSVAVPLGGEDYLVAALHKGLSIEFPDARLSRVADKTRAIRTAPDQLLLMFPYAEPSPENGIDHRLASTGYTTDQSDAWVVLDLSGPDTLSALERLCPVDLDIGQFPLNAAARTLMEHMGTLIVRIEQNRFLLLSASSSAGSFLDAVETSYRYVCA